MNMLSRPSLVLGSSLLILGLAASAPAMAQADGEGLLIYFDHGSGEIGEPELAKLDQAARLYRDGNPIIMTITGATDRSGPAETNLQLSIARANAVTQGLVERGIPIERLQIAGKGETEPMVPTGDGAETGRNRVVEINWR